MLWCCCPIDLAAHSQLLNSQGARGVEQEFPIFFVGGKRELPNSHDFADAPTGDDVEFPCALNKVKL